MEFVQAFLAASLSESCGKCVPCRIGLKKLSEIHEKILSGAGEMSDLDTMEELAHAIEDSADCAIGFTAAREVLNALVAFKKEYTAAICGTQGSTPFQPVPCQATCPAHVDIPAYIALTKEGRYADAVRVIRNDNPFPTVCGLICEHPCEKACRRSLVDAPINIRGIKKFAAENAGEVPAPACLPKNGKRVAIVGGGPAGLTAAYFLQLKGFSCTVFEKRPTLGGMLRYGIPAYRLPDANLDGDINVILSTGVEVKYGVNIGKDVTLQSLRDEYDAVYLSIGAHGAKKLRCEGEDLKGVLSAVELLGATAAGEKPDFTGKNVLIVGGGNVAMDATRTSRRLGAKSVTCVYRRRVEDMTALPEEVRGAQAEGCEMLELMSPVRIVGENGVVTGLVVKPQIPGAIRDGRPSPKDSSEPEVTIPADIVIIAIGQAIESRVFEAEGVSVNREKIVANPDGSVQGAEGILPGVFTGGDCYTGPATVIRAIDAGKVAAENIEKYFGFETDVREKIEIPAASAFSKLYTGRVQLRERSAAERGEDFEMMELPMTKEEADQECSRCLRCDHYGLGACQGKRK